MADVESGVFNEGFDQVEEKNPRKSSLDSIEGNRKKKSEPYHQLEWREISYTVEKTRFELKPPFGLKLVPFEKEILQPQSGSMRSGEMTALMGPSGAGKTTLLNVITGKCDPGFVSGDVNFVTSSPSVASSKVAASSVASSVASSKVAASSVASSVASSSEGKSSFKDGGKKLQLKLSYVAQEDFLHQNFTVRETLTFAFKFNLRMRKTFSKHEIKTKVEKLALDINLASSLDTKISDCSGGQVKRVSVAIELISNPNILILDEPTTGLDSVNALLMISTIKKLLSKKSTFDTFDTFGTNNNQSYTPPAVICAIHQPSIEIFELFDQIYVLSSEGQNVFSGHPSLVSKFLAMNDIVLRPSANPADFLLMLCSSGKEIQRMNENGEWGRERMKKESGELGRERMKKESGELGRERMKESGELGRERMNESGELGRERMNENGELGRETVGLGRKTSIRVSEARKESDLLGSSVFSTVSLLLERQVKILRHNPWPVMIRSVFCLLSTIIMKSMYNHPIGSHNGCYDEIFGLNGPSLNGSPLNGPSLDGSPLNGPSLDGSPLNGSPLNGSITATLFSRNMEPLFEESMNRITRVLDNVGYLLFSPTFIIIVHSFMALVETPSEMKIIMKEVSNSWYSVNTYLTARIFVSFFIVIFHISSFVWFMAFMSSQQLDLERFFFISFSWILLAWISELTGFMIGVAFHSHLAVAVLIQVYAIFPLILFSGFFVKPVSIPLVLEKVTFVSQLKHVFYATMIAVYGRGRCSSTNENDSTFSDFLKSTPIQMISRFMERNNVTHEASNLISPVLGLPDNFCLAQVINATRDYFSIPSTFIGTNDTVDYDTFINDTVDYDTIVNDTVDYDTIVNDTVDYEYSMEKSSEPVIRRELSFPLSMFGINEEDLPLCYYSLVTIFLIYLFLTFMTFRFIVKN